MKNYKTIIIGCGASGMMAALNAKDKVAIIDSVSKPFKKILVTGNGRCNLTNTNMSSQFFNTNIDKYLQVFDQKQTLKFFESLGLVTYADEEGRVYPLSNQAKSVQDVLLARLESKADLYMGEAVIDITKSSCGYIVKTPSNEFSCERLVIASGGNSLLESIKTLGVKIKPFVPSLTALKCDNIRDLNGVKVDAVVIVSDSKEKFVERGEVLFKDGGVSGIVVFNASSFFARKGKFDGSITIDILPDYTPEQTIEKIKARTQLNVNADKLFVGMFNNALANEIFKKSKVNTNINSLELSLESINKLAQTIKNMEYKVTGYFDNNQVYSGGLPLTELDGNLMSKSHPNLYFAGEVCDVDGVCGGYNLQWAWTSGKIVGDNLC